MPSSSDYFQHLLMLHHLEKEEDKRLFELVAKTNSVQQKIQLGVCWQPLRVVETGYGFGEYPFALLERTRQQGQAHQFGSGKPVQVFSADPQCTDVAKGSIVFVNADQIKVVFICDELPEVFEYGKLGVQLLFDEGAYQETEKAMQLIAGAKNCRLAELRDILIKNKPTTVYEDDEIDHAAVSSVLNASQKAAVELMLKNKDVSILHGPPGTGKTTTLVEVARLLCFDGEQVMMCAPSNAAADWLSHKAIAAGLNVIRIGNPAKIDAELEAHTPEGFLQQHSQYSDIKSMRKRSNELRRMASKYKRNFGYAEREQRKLILQEARLVGAEARRLEQHIIGLAIEQADVITCTLVGSTNNVLEKRTFSTVFIDEAAQAPEPACWIPIIRAERVILAGDPFQLPPTIKSQEAAAKGLSTTLIEKLISGDNVALLTKQYRMHNAIMEFSNEWFYGGKLESAEKVANWQIENEQVLTFIDTAGLGWSEIENPETRSLYNPEEADFLWKRLMKLGEQLAPLSFVTVGVISPYREQVAYLDNQWKEMKADFNKDITVEVQTIDSFQGQERDVILVSLVRSNERSEIGFLADYRRMNVAMTRAKKKLVLIGDSATLGKDPFYKALIEHAEKREAYISAWELLG